MAIAVADSIATNSGSSSSTSATVNIPDSLASGDLVIAFVRKSFETGLTWPASPAWTVLTDAGDGSDDRVGIAYRYIDGTEGWGSTGNSITVTGSNSTHWVGMAFKISGHDSANAPELSSEGQSSSATVTPAGVSPSLTNRDQLFIGIYTWAATSDINETPPNGDSNWTVPLSQQSSAGTGAARVNCDSAYRQQDAQSSVTAPTWALTASFNWAAWTLVAFGSTAPAAISPVDLTSTPVAATGYHAYFGRPSALAVTPTIVDPSRLLYFPTTAVAFTATAVAPTIGLALRPSAVAITATPVAPTHVLGAMVLEYPAATTWAAEAAAASSWTEETPASATWTEE